MKLTAFVLTVLTVLFLCSCQREPDVDFNKEVSITSFSPDSGRVGTVVTIRGKGFDTSWSNHSVQVNGVKAQLLTVSDTVMQIMILPGTTSGKITVTFHNQTVSSTKSFVILTDTLAITSFSPGSGKADTEVTIRGIGFDPAPAGNRVTINHTETTIISSSDSVLVVKVQPGTTTGKITVTVRGKTANSSSDFVIQHGWVQKADYPKSWSEYAANGNGFINGFSSGDKGYFYKSNQLWEYDPVTNAWTRKADLPSASVKNFCFSFVCNNKVYIGLGAPAEGMDISTEPGSNEVWEYDIARNQWSKKRGFPGVARVAPFSFSINNIGYMGGGDTTNTGMPAVNDFWRYDPQTDTWSQQAHFPGAQAVGITGFAIGSSGYVFEAGHGNPTAPTAGFDVVNLWKYDPATNSWAQKAVFPSRGVISATAFTVHQKGYVALGIMDANSVASKNDFWEYDPAADQWTQKESVGGGIRWFGSSFSIGNKGYVGVGNGEVFDEVKTDFWEYTF